MEIKDFKAYIEKQRKELHKDVLYEICLLINNCANCYDEELRKTECNCINCVDIFKVNANSFYIEPYDDKTNGKLIDIGKECGYNVGFVLGGEYDGMIKFYK